MTTTSTRCRSSSSAPVRSPTSVTTADSGSSTRAAASVSWAEMTATTSLRADERSLAGLSDPVGARLAEIADRLTAHCLVEAADGGVISHALGADEAPDAYASAVLHRDA